MQGVYSIAGVIVKLTYSFEWTGRYFERYSYDGDRAVDVDLEITKTDIESEGKIFPDNPDYFLENLAVLRKLSKILLVDYNAMLFHGSSVKYKDKAFVFTAPSGTGKSTHVKLLKSYLGDELLYINDDKPIIKEEGGKIYVYGSPWNGKHGRGQNISALLKGVCIIKRAKENSIEKISPALALKFLFEQSLGFDDEKSATKVLEILSLVTMQANFYVLHCNMELDAAKTSFEGMIYED
jgi:hypothetical protein